ncbi:MAG: hypothetical protein NTW59_03755 [Candidatus Diapherotrites archaeon]|nr:hypothetical protein [Candidatus Diapherotrites archaeon]
MNNFFEQTVLELTRKGDLKKVKFLRGLHRHIMPSQVARINQNDRGVLREIVLPKWVSWDLLRAWADNFKEEGKGKICILCNSQSDLGVDFRDKFICENCFIRLKQLT